ncbi:MAG: hypothetical protein RR705_10515, partial [Lachnospiraceae bacterium]
TVIDDQKTSGSEHPILVFSSKDDLVDALTQMKTGTPFEALRTNMNIRGTATRTNSEFRSLLEVNMERELSALTTVQRNEIALDQELLEYCPNDSIIADIQFAQLLNVSREIQIDNTVYKYVSNGVAFTNAKDAAELKTIEEKAVKIKIMPEMESSTITLTPKVKFIPMEYQQTVYEEQSTSFMHRTITEGFTLKNGTYIPANSIREVNYTDNGDGSWIHRTWNGIFGRNILAINKFSSKRRMRLNFYDQNYIIYANIGTEVKMQKKVCGIWWNIKAQEIRHGWSAIELKYLFPSPILPKMPINPLTKPVTYKPELPSFMKHRFPFQDEDALLIHLPFNLYDVTNKDLNNAFKSGMNAALNAGTAWIKSEVNSYKSNGKAKNVGIFSINNNVIYTIMGADENYISNRSTSETKYYSKWFPGTYVIGFSLGNSVNVNNVKLDGGNSTSLQRGIVYAAVKYDNKWLAARITKDK